MAGMSLNGYPMVGLGGWEPLFLLWMAREDHVTQWCHLPWASFPPFTYLLGSKTIQIPSSLPDHCSNKPELRK